jgi:hypothetical protein
MLVLSGERPATGILFIMGRPASTKGKWRNGCPRCATTGTADKWGRAASVPVHILVSSKASTIAGAVSVQYCSVLKKFDIEKM